jgi:hypothetical protein
LEKADGKMGVAVGRKLHNEVDTPWQQLYGVIKRLCIRLHVWKTNPVIFVCTAPQNTTLMYVRLNQKSDTKVTLSKIEACNEKI